MTQPAHNAAPPASPPAEGPAAEPWTAHAGWRLLPARERDSLAPLLRFIAAARAVADHPALPPDRKEAALAALAAPFSNEAVPPDAEAWAAAARALAAHLSARGCTGDAPWQILQAAGQDLRKTRYRDWSDLLTWCRFAAAPGAVLAFRLAGAPDGATKSAEALAIGIQLVELVRLAHGHYAWLGRVYLPERWFREARAEVGDLGFSRISEPLSAVIGRALDQAAALLDDGVKAAGQLPGLRLRAALFAAVLEARREIALLRRRRDWTLPPPPSRGVRNWIALRALAAALRRR